MASMTGTIPLSQTVSINPATLGTEGGVPFMNGLLITGPSDSAALSTGTLKQYGSLSDVTRDFPTNGIEARMAAVYFGSHEDAAQTPATLLIYMADPTHQADPAGLMELITSQSQNFAGFTTVWEPTLAQKQAFATWVAGQSDRYWYVAWDTDEQALAAQNSTSFGTWLQAQAIDGTTLLYHDPLAAAFCLGWMASIDFDATNGRTNLCFRRSGLLTPSVTDAVTAATLRSNGYNFYGAYANGLGRFQWLEDGHVSGAFLWADSYINQIWLNAAFQSALTTLLLQSGQIPYDTIGDGMISAAVQDVINQALRFGAIRPGIQLTSLQKQQIDRSAGTTISDTVQTRGWYFQPNASTAAASIRTARKSPPCRFWYTDGQSVQSISLTSIEVQ
ncbi:DUF3383 domain-containing protein [Bombella sp. TMW 2.2543]|uniref:DUF3383 domain-containing protein n=1 Tax=Bombella pluederhausensis TaxID=2967336 RepID=A0ABT3WDG7_9PROT|nr:DUF3383 family protein [Bombella pluederhausensis]MCX5617122.1 DUF3383 domain-containing protein [Bombella pluederhausensis]